MFKVPHHQTYTTWGLRQIDFLQLGEDPKPDALGRPINSITRTDAITKQLSIMIILY